MPSSLELWRTISCLVFSNVLLEMHELRSPITIIQAHNLTLFYILMQNIVPIFNKYCFLLPCTPRRKYFLHSFTKGCVPLLKITLLIPHYFCYSHHQDHLLITVCICLWLILWFLEYMWESYHFLMSSNIVTPKHSYNEIHVFIIN